ncbi:MAG TPA: hypothetical protein VL547_16865 [Dinghuibacter sp.]|uniref:hypothetical protein n=1 Tax=Dinghuibacter sp. TaxID=2024697 RepID=UPI002C1E9120|nr:hypothetical protein [Dinghuibacter sp.]HTJ13712.1 hypothetical protein [Dinghuibacter sp.]
MTAVHVLTLALGVVGFPAFLLSKRKTQAPSQQNHNNNNWLEQLRLDRNPYQSLRFLAITTPPYKYNGVAVDSIYGIIMDYPVKNGTGTLASYITGECSLYMSNGSGIINGEKHETVRLAAMDLVELAARNMSTSIPTTRYPAATNEFVRFYILTTEGVRTSWFRVSDLNRSEEGHALFAEANKVIRTMQLTTVLN